MTHAQHLDQRTRPSAAPAPTVSGRPTRGTAIEPLGDAPTRHGALMPIDRTACIADLVGDVGIEGDDVDAGLQAQIAAVQIVQNDILRGDAGRVPSGPA